MILATCALYLARGDNVQVTDPTQLMLPQISHDHHEFDMDVGHANIRPAAGRSAISNCYCERHLIIAECITSPVEVIDAL